MTDEYRKLYRSRNERMIGGVCGGLARYFNVDPTVIRLLFVLGFFLFSSTFWAYLVLWIVVPEEPVTF